MKSEESKLDNPVWNSLSEIHKNHGIDYSGIKFYNPKYCVLEGSIDVAKSIKGISDYSTQIESFCIVRKRPVFKKELGLCNELVCNQMILDGYK